MEPNATASQHLQTATPPQTIQIEPHDGLEPSQDPSLRITVPSSIASHTNTPTSFRQKRGDSITELDAGPKRSRFDPVLLAGFHTFSISTEGASAPSATRDGINSAMITGGRIPSADQSAPSSPVIGNSSDDGHADEQTATHMQKGFSEDFSQSPMQPPRAREAVDGKLSPSAAALLSQAERLQDLHRQVSSPKYSGLSASPHPVRSSVSHSSQIESRSAETGAAQRSSRQLHTRLFDAGVSVACQTDSAVLALAESSFSANPASENAMADSQQSIPSAPNTDAQQNVEWCMQRLQSLRRTENSLAQRFETVRTEMQRIHQMLHRFVGPRQTFVAHVSDLSARLGLESPYARILLLLPTAVLQYSQQSKGDWSPLELQFSILRSFILHGSSRVATLAVGYYQDGSSVAQQLGLRTFDNDTTTVADHGMSEVVEDVMKLSSVSQRFRQGVSTANEGRALDATTQAIMDLDKSLCAAAASRSHPNPEQLRDLVTLSYLSLECTNDKLDLLRATTLPVFESAHRSCFTSNDPTPGDMWNISSIRLALPHVAHQLLNLLNVGTEKLGPILPPSETWNWNLVAEIQRCLSVINQSILDSDMDEWLSNGLASYRSLVTYLSLMKGRRTA
eukprot:TRINITY_DN870_c0_g2_i1.p1 TRINITY_DN870_c0_g2~~TRINITY_DN870_c0_g2_i1.p1  ORF type:complete len:623 (+),score=123.58 TRINITY_DN870_c0_g2_i1:146-2014(+)